MSSSGVTIEGLDLMEVINYMHKKTRKHVALLLSDLEEVVTEREFKLVRKLVLDSYNDHTRSLVRLLFGNVEDQEYTDAGFDS